MQLIPYWFALAFLIRAAFADVSITKPTSGNTYTALGGSVSVELAWEDDLGSDDDAASLTNAASFTIVLCTGPNSDIKAVATLTEGLANTVTSYTADIAASDAPDGTYFFQVYAVFTLGYTIHYSNRFKLSGMTGSASTLTFSASLLSITGDGPGAQSALTTTATYALSMFSVTYTLQTGTVRFAPMQTQPGSTITHTSWSRRHATSSYTPYSTIRPSPSVYSTITPGWDYAVTSKYNTATVIGQPSYWYPASSRVVAASISSANKKRWY